MNDLEALAEGLHASVEAFLAKRLQDFDRTLTERLASVEKTLPSLILPALLEQVRGLVVAESEKSAKLATFSLREELAAILKESREANVNILEASNAVLKLPDTLTIAANISASVKAAVDALPVKEGAPGKSVTVEELQPAIIKAVEAAVAALPPPEKGADAVVDYARVEAFCIKLFGDERSALIQIEVKEQVRDAVDAAIAALPPPAKGADATIDYAQVETFCVKAVAEKFALAPAIIKEEVRSYVDAAVALLPLPAPGKDAKVDEEALHAFCAEHIKSLVDALPPAKDGKSVSLDEVAAALTPAMNLFVRETLLQNAPSIGHIKDMVDAAVARLPVPKDGSSVTLAEATAALLPSVEEFLRTAAEENAPSIAFVKTMVDTAVAQLPAPKDGKSVSVEEVTPIVASLVTEAVAAKPIPLPDWKAVAAEALARERASAPPPEPAPAPEVDYKRIINELHGFLEGAVSDAIAAMPTPANGKDADPAVVAKMVEDAVSAIEIVIPDPIPGKSVDVAELRDIVKGELAQAVLALPKEKPVDFDAVKALVDIAVKQYVSTLPASPAGKDGLSVKDFGVELLPDERTLRFSLASESQEETVTKDVILPIVVSRDAYETDKMYARGDSVAWDGSWWVAKRPTSDAPGSSDAWKLMAQRGRPGRDREAVVKEGSERVRLK